MLLCDVTSFLVAHWVIFPFVYISKQSHVHLSQSASRKEEGRFIFMNITLVSVKLEIMLRIPAVIHKKSMGNYYCIALAM